MAVVMATRSTSTSSQCIGRSEFSNFTLDNKIQTSKKECCRPEMQLYCPRMSLKNKTSGIEDYSSKFDSKKYSQESRKKSPSSDRFVGGVHEKYKSETNEIGDMHVSKNNRNKHPSQMFIQKKLFDPNNPEKPEIINIPAPLPPHLSYPSESSNTSIAPPVPCSVPDIRTNYTHSSVCFGDVTSISAEPVKKKLKPIVEKNLQDISLLERKLTSILGKGVSRENLLSASHCRWKLQLRYENIILADPKYCAEGNPEQSLWKTSFHQIIELLRKKLEENPEDKEETTADLKNIIAEGTKFFENLIDKLQETFGFNLSNYEKANFSNIPEAIRIVLISVQKLLIYLGDLARYKEQACQTSYYGKARRWCIKAQQIAPKNGRPYHQLAILSFHTRRKLDAVYYYIRSLAASNPILSAKESLLSLFEEAKRKYELYDKKRTEKSAVEIYEESIGKFNAIWIKSDGSSYQQPAEIDKNLDMSEVKKLSDAELNKRFITSFLHVHGKLFTRVGMGSFPDVLNSMLKDFYFLLQRSPLPITSSRLLQLLAINIFSVENTSMKEDGHTHGGRSSLQEKALYAGMIMMSMLMERCYMLHVAHRSSHEFSNQMLSDDIAELLPSVKIWTDWMGCQKYLWPPPPSYVSEMLNVGFSKNVWESFADLLSVLREYDISATKIIRVEEGECERIILEEDIHFAGFVPLLTAINDPAYAVHPFDKDHAKHCHRIKKIQFFGDYLCGVIPPLLELDIGSKKFVSLIKEIYSEDNYERSALSNVQDSHRGCNINKIISLLQSFHGHMGKDELECNLSGKTFQDDPKNHEIQVLRSRKEALCKIKEQQERRNAQIQAILKRATRPVVLQIKPKYLVPDTNCFIGHLRLFRNILASTNFHFIVPLVVINELEGLAQGPRVNEHTSPQRSARVAVLSRKALHFLKEQFTQRNPQLRAITSKGSVLDTISFRSEEMGKKKGNNDDVILNCCLYYCKDVAESCTQSDNPVTLFREVILLTDDRCLRIKAYAHHVPVSDLQSFIQWFNSTVGDATAICG